MVSSVPMRRRLCRRHDGVVALVAMELLLLPMRRHLAVVGDDGDGVTGDSIVDKSDSVTNVNIDGDGATDANIDDNYCGGQWLRGPQWR